MVQNRQTVKHGLNVSMKSGLEGRNNCCCRVLCVSPLGVSMKSGLEGRNNARHTERTTHQKDCLNEVRPRRPEQSPYVLPIPRPPTMSQ